MALHNRAAARHVSRIPVNLGPIQLYHETDSIGGSGDRCPMLFSNDIALRRKLVSHHGYYENGDRMLLFPHDEGTYGLRMLLTDSGHYLLPIKETLRADTSPANTEVFSAGALFTGIKEVCECVQQESVGVLISSTTLPRVISSSEQCSKDTP